MRHLSCKRVSGFLFVAALLLISSPVLARDASFLDPGTASGSVAPDAVTVEPKGDIDLGESSIGVARRVVTFFVNQTSIPVEIETIVVNGDSSITATIVGDDCSKENRIAPNSRCSVVISVTPSSTGIWSSEVMMTHKAAGRIARTRISGRATQPPGLSERKDTGLSFSNKEVTPINFGEVDVDSGRSVRSALMVNDSQDPLTIMSIDLIAAENGMERLEQGCNVDMELKTGESCPITLMWKPLKKGAVSTDLIVRHTGKMGFVVIPVRGVAKETLVAGGSSSTPELGKKSTRGASDRMPLPPTADELEKIAAGKIPQVSSGAMGVSSGSGKDMESSSAYSGGPAVFRLIGTVGNRAVLFTPDGTTTVASIGEDILWGEGHIAKLTNIFPKTVELFVDGKKKTLDITTAPELRARGVVTTSTAQASGGTSSLMPSAESKR